MRTKKKTTPTAEPTPERPRARLLRVNLVPTFVIDDGETLSEITAAEVAVSAKEWPEFAAGGDRSPFSEAGLEAIVDQYLAAQQQAD